MIPQGAQETLLEAAGYTVCRYRGAVLGRTLGRPATDSPRRIRCAPLVYWAYVNRHAQVVGCERRADAYEHACKSDD